MQLHEAFVCQKTHGQLLPGHFQVEDCHRLFILFRHVHADIQGEGGFAHGGTGSDQQQIRLVETVDLGIQIPQTGRQTGDQGVGHGQLIQPVKDPVHGGPNVLQTIPPLTLADGIDLLLRRLQDVSRGTHLVEYHVRDLPRSLSQATKQGFFLNNVGITNHIGSRGGNLHELHDIVSGIVVIIAQLF